MGDRIIHSGVRAAIVSFILTLMMFMSSNAAIRTGGIQLNLQCYEETGEGRKIFDKKPELMPNEESSYVLAVDNKGAEAWIRLHISFQKMEPEENTPDIDEDWLLGISREWVKKGEYWYYKKPVGKEEVVFCKGIRVPDLNDLPKGMKFSLTSRVEAVQAAHVVPDFSSEDPFEGILIEESTGNYEQDVIIDGFEIRYENGADTIVDADNLFAQVKELMPGDVISEKIMIHNETADSVRVRISELGMEPNNPAKKALILTIKRKGLILYHGALLDSSLKNGIWLGEFSKRGKEEVEFVLSLPKEAANETAFQTIPAAFVFYAEKKQQTFDPPYWSEEQESDAEQYVHISPDPSVSFGHYGGEWKLLNEEAHLWEYVFEDKSKAQNGWYYLANPYSPDENKNGWFYFNESGRMQFGWIRSDSNNWYFCHEKSDGNLGRLKTGWHYDQDDQRQYYLDPVTGIMRTGWQWIEGTYYYFTPLEYTKRQNWFWNTGIGRWLYDYLGYRTYGSMYRNERTPDGYEVDENGAWNGSLQ